MNGRVLIALFLIAVFSLGAIVLAAPRGDNDSVATGTSRFEGAVMPDGLKAPDFTLTNQDGERISMRDFRGQPVIVTFLYTTCEDTCPVQAQTVRRALGRLDFVLGTRAELKPLWKGFYVRPQSVTHEHNARFTLVDERGFQRVGYPGFEATAERIALDIRILQAE